VPVTPTAECSVRVWACETEVPGELARYAELLPPEVAGRVDRLRSPAHRAEAIVSAAFLRGVLGRELAADPLELTFASTCRWCGHPTHGKPALVRPEQGASLSFSLSHTAGLAILAIADREVGVDVERVRDKDVGERGPLVLTDLERARLDEGINRDDPAAFLRLWTRKEAYLKGIGLGLAQDPSRVSFAEERSGWAKVEDAGAATGWHVRLLDLDRRWVGALAVDGGPCPVQVERWFLV
jgi:4'-phosphopantetheinyl transferase